jgi:three-Cys-motif partner protein
MEHKMPRENHKWVPGEEPPKIRPHSLAKHRVIDAYLRRYVDVLTQNRRIPEFRLTLVDGFSGGGVYRDWKTGERQPGSPMIMLEAMRDAAIAAQEKRSKEFNLDVEYFFIEKKPTFFSYLESTLRESEFQTFLGQQVHLLRGNFVEQLPAILQQIRQRGRGERAILLLDQFGYKDVPMPEIRRIFSELKNAEVILTFATDAMINYLSESEVTQKILGRIGLELTADQITIRKQMREWRQAIQLLLHGEIQQKSGAKFYTPFFIRSPDEHRDFWLIHLSGLCSDN